LQFLGSFCSNVLLAYMKLALIDPVHVT